MPFSTRTITHTFENADGTPASGAVQATLSKRMTNGTTTLVPASITSNLTSGGALSIVLTANDDQGTNPTDAQWRIDLRILGAQEEQFWITVPSGSGAIDLGTLLPQNPDGG